MNELKLTKNARRSALVALAMLVVVPLLAACGSGKSTKSTTSTSQAANAGGDARRAQLLACLKQQGVSVPSKPQGAAGGGSGGGGGGAGTGTTPRRGLSLGAVRNPKLRAALQTCRAKLGIGRFRRRPSRQAIQSYVACVRQHGFNLPTPNYSGKGPVFPANIRTNPKFQAASRHCRRLLVPPRGSPPRSTTTTSGA